MVADDSEVLQPPATQTQLTPLAERKEQVGGELGSDTPEPVKLLERLRRSWQMKGSR